MPDEQDQVVDVAEIELPELDVKPDVQDEVVEEDNPGDGVGEDDKELEGKSEDEAQKEEVKPPKPGEKSKEWSKALRHGQKLRKEQELLKSERAQFLKEREEVQKQALALQDVHATLAKAKTDPVKALEILGWNMQKLNEWVLSNGMPSETDTVQKQLREEVEALKRDRLEEKERIKKAQLDEQEKQRRTSVKQNQELLQKFVIDNEEQFELSATKAKNGFDVGEMLFAIADEAFEQRGEELTFKQAAELYEKHLEQEAQMYAATKKGSLKREGQGDAPQQRQPTKTISAKLTGRTAPKVKASSQEELEAELAEELETILNPKN